LWVAEVFGVGDEEFISRRLNRKSRRPRCEDVVHGNDTFSAKVLGTDVLVTGEEVERFVKSYEVRLADYLHKPFLRVLPSGILTRDIKNFRGYVLGAAICKHYGFPDKRFIETQFYFHDDWKGSAPTIQYVTSLNSGWNSVGRYKSYCDKFKTEIDYFGEGDDNVDPAYKVEDRRVKDSLPTAGLIQIYEEMIDFQIFSKNNSRKQVLKILGRPGNNYIPIQYLKTLPLYLELVDEDAWGNTAYTFDFYKQIKSEIENTKNAR